MDNDLNLKGKKKIFIRFSFVFIFLAVTTLSHLFFVQAGIDTGKTEIAQDYLSDDSKSKVSMQSSTADSEVEQTSLAGTSTEKELFSLDEVIAESLKSNSLLQSLDYLIETKEINWREQQDSARQIAEAEVKNLDSAKVKYFLPYDADIQVKVAKLDKENQENEISIQAINAYMDTLYTQEAIVVLENGVKRAEEQLVTAKLNYEVGTITKVDVLSADVQLEQTKSELEQAKNNLKVKEMQLNQVMNRSLTLPIELKMPDLNSDVSMDEEEVLNGLNYNLSIKQQKLELQSIDKLLNITKSFFSEKTYAYKSVMATKLTKESTISETKSKVELGIRSQQIKIDSLKQTWNIMKQQVEKVEETYQIMQHQYKAGFISYQEFANTDQLLKQTGLEELQAKIDYYKAVFEYKYMIGMKL